MPSYPALGDRIGRFRVLAQLGAGGMGVVYDALEENLDRRVALKVIAPLYADDPAFRERFAQEARALASLDSPHVVQVFAHGEEDGYLYIATQLIPDGDLGQLVGRWGPAPLGKAADLIAQVASGLADAHAARMVHRDIKPANVLVRRRGSGAEVSVAAYLGDFGIARRVDADAIRAGEQAGEQAGGQAGGQAGEQAARPVGTPSYMAPELHHGAPASAASDVYSLGCVLWVTLTGSPPYPATTELATITAHLDSPVPQLRGSGPLVDAVNRVLQRAMAKAPEQRYQRATDLRDDLRRAAAMSGDQMYLTLGAAVRPPAGPPYGPPYGPPVAAPPPRPPAPLRVTYPAPPHSPSRPRRSVGLWMIWLVTATVLVVGVVVTAVLVGGAGEPGSEVVAPASSPTGPTGPTGPTSPASPRGPTGPDEPSQTEFVDQAPRLILATARTQMRALDTYHVSGDVLSGGDRLRIDLRITTRGDCGGTISTGGGSAQLRRIGSEVWVRADEAFWVAATDPTLGPRIAAITRGRWLAPDAEGDAVAEVCDLDGLLAPTGGAAVGVLGPARIDGRRVVEVDTGASAGGERSVTSVALGDPHYIVEVDGGADGSLTFSDFDEPFAARAPAGRRVIDVGSLGG